MISATYHPSGARNCAGAAVISHRRAFGATREGARHPHEIGAATNYKLAQAPRWAPFARSGSHCTRDRVSGVARFRGSRTVLLAWSFRIEVRPSDRFSNSTPRRLFMKAHDARSSSSVLIQHSPELRRKRRLTENTCDREATSQSRDLPEEGRRSYGFCAAVIAREYPSRGRWRREWNWDLTFSRSNDAAKYTKEIL